MARRQGVASADEMIVGAWQIEGGDYPLIDEYREDGTLIQRVGDRCGKPMPFRIEADLLIVMVKQPDGSVFEDKTRFSVAGDTLTFFDGPNSKRVFRRVGSSPHGSH